MRIKIRGRRKTRRWWKTRWRKKRKGKRRRKHVSIGRGVRNRGGGMSKSLTCWEGRKTALKQHGRACISEQRSSVSNLSN